MARCLRRRARLRPHRGRPNGRALLIPSGEACHLNTHPVDRFVRLVPELN